jgi:hypothetical protein
MQSDDSEGKIRRVVDRWPIVALVFGGVVTAVWAGALLWLVVAAVASLL